MGCRQAVPSLLLLIVTLRFRVAHAWTCSISINGTPSLADSTITECSLLCRPGTGEASSGKLPVVVHPALDGCLFTGVTPNFTLSQETRKPGLIVFKNASNVTLEDSRMINIQGLDLNSIVTFTSCTNVTVSNMTSYGCEAWQVLASFNKPQDPSSLFLVQASSFTSSESGGIYVTYHDLTVRDTVFDSLVASVNSTVDTVLHHDNTDGGFTSIENCTFSNTQSLGKYSSSAVGIFRPNLLISRSRFINCTAAYAVVNILNFPLLDGSYSANGTATIEGCTFQGNTATQSCVYMIGKDSTPNQQLNLYNSRFVGNTANFGAAVTTFAVGTVQVAACVFEANFAAWGLSALYVYGWVQQLTYFTMRDSVFRNNNGTRTTLASTEGTGITDTAECGGAYLSSCKCVGITDSVFENNVGKGLCVHGQLGSSPDCSNSDPVFFNKTTIAGPANDQFLTNFLGRYDDLVITVDIRRSHFTNNTDAFLTRTTAEPEDVQPIDYLTGGAGVDIQAVLFTVLSSSTFSSNRGRQGSALHLDTCFMTYVWNSTFDSNIATGQGGALAVVNTHSKGLLVANSTFRNSQALFGGAIYADVGAAITLSNSSQLIHNQATTGGAIFCDNCQRLVLELQTELSFNTADTGGGAVYCDGCVLLTAIDVLMTHNSAGGPGGALAISGNGYTLSNISTSAFYSNTAVLTQSSPLLENADANGGAINADGGVMVLTQNTFVNNTADSHGGAVAYAYQCFTVIDTSDALFFLWAQLAPDLAALAGNCSYFISTANAFGGNHANIAGGIIYSSNVNSMRLSCTAAEEDHSPSLDCPDWSSSSSSSSSSGSGSSSSSSSSGSSSSSSGSSSSTFPANTVGAAGIVGYGPGLAFPPAAVVFGSSGSSSMEMRYISDGSTDVPVPAINVLDQAGNKVKAQPLRANVTVTTVMAEAGVMPQLPGQTEAHGDANGDINIAELVLIASPGVYDLQLALPDFPEVPAAILQINVQPCGVGQVPTQDGNECIACPSSTYSFDPASGACKPCPAQGTCSGGATLVPQQQYWHSAPDSDHIVTCPNSNACAGDTSALLACQNATYQAQLDVSQDTVAQAECTLNDPWTSSNPESYMRQLCAQGYYGPVCSLCISSGDVTYGRVGGLQCQPCRRTVSIISAYIASALLVLAWLSYTIHVTLVENEEAAAGHDDPQYTSQLIRALNLWLQYITLLGSINIPAPSTVHWVFSAAQFAFATVSSGSLSTDCLLTGPVNHALQRILIHLTVPVLMFIVLAAIQLLRWWRSNKRSASTPTGPVPTPFSAALHTSSSAELKRRLLITLLEVLFYYYPSLLTTTLSLFACFHIDPAGATADQYHHAQANWGFGYWVPDMSIECFTGWHRKLAIILGTPLMTLTWVVIPLMPVFLLFRHRDNLQAPKVQLQLGYIYRIYRPELWFWNSIVLVLTLALAASQVFATALDTYFQLAIMLMILMMGLTAHAHFRPFTNNLLQRMQVLGIFVVQVTATGCLYFLDPTNIANSRGLAAVGIALLVLNLGYVVVMLVLIAMFGAAKTKHFTRQAFAALKTSSMKLRHSISGLSTSSSFTGRSGVLGRSSTDSQAAILGGGKVMSLMPSSFVDSSSSLPVSLSAHGANRTPAQQMPLAST